MPYIKAQEFERLKQGQQQLDKIVTILVQSLDNPPSDGIAKAEEIAQDLVSSYNLLFKVNAENTRLAEALDIKSKLVEDVEDRLRSSTEQLALEIEVNEDLNAQLKKTKDQTVELQRLRQAELYRLRHSYRLLEDEKSESDANVRRLKSALQSVLGCIK